MKLKVMIPFEILLEKEGLIRLVAETTKGSFGLLPLRLDCTALLVPGIVSYEAQGEEEKYIAVDEGILIKTGSEVVLSVRRALVGYPLGELKKMLEKEWNKKKERDSGTSHTFSKLENTFIRRIVELHHE
jgi:F-type H+-transporting ATPase subunit epsilon